MLFLCAVCAIAYLFPRKIRYIWLLLASWVVYLYSPNDLAKNLPAFGLLLLATFASFLCALAIGRAKARWAKRVWLGLSLAVCLGMLAVCKYLNFFASIGAGVAGLFSSGAVQAAHFNLVLPLGISYFVLQGVSYTIDVYTGKMEAEKNPALYALYMSFFSSVVTGPINRANEMLPQYRSPPKFSYDNVAGGLFRVLWGFVKKMVIADNIAPFTLKVFGAPGSYPGPYLVLAVLLFAYQLYADFSGSCDIAIGAARMLGFNFRENFNRPFAAKTYQKLWQRWHMSLTSWFQDYVFIPLVWSRWTEKLPVIGKRVKAPPAISSILIVFLVSGLWHGAGYGYLLWGLLNGVILMLSARFGDKKERFAASVPIYHMRHLRGFVQRVLVYLMFALCLVPFAFDMYRTPLAAAWAALRQGWGSLFSGELLATAQPFGFDPLVLAVLAALVLLVEILEKLGVKKNSNMADWIRRQKFFVRWPVYYVLLAALMAFGAFGLSQFIYQVY